MNVFDLPELLDEVEKLGLSVFLILAWFPHYYSIRNIPPGIANEIAENLLATKRNELMPIIQALSNGYQDEHWEKFKSWTAMVDKYRNESFPTTFDEYTRTIRKYEMDFFN